LHLNLSAFRPNIAHFSGDAEAARQERDANILVKAEPLDR
jgi:hypothetical protein